MAAALARKQRGAIKGIIAPRRRNAYHGVMSRGVWHGAYHGMRMFSHLLARRGA